MDIGLRKLDEMPPLAGIAGAGARGVNFARLYLEKELPPEDALSGCRLITLNSAEAADPAVLLVIAFAGDAGVRRELAAWAEGYESAPRQLVLFYIVGDLDGITLPGSCVPIADNASADVQLTAALNCVAQALAGHNLINLRVCDLREVCAEARQLYFATGLGSGKERVRAALDQALATPGLREHLQSAHGVWVQAAAAGGPALGELDRVGASLKGSTHADAIIHLGGMNLRADESGLRVSILVSAS